MNAMIIKATHQPFDFSLSIRLAPIWLREFFKPEKNKFQRSDDLYITRSM
jgi:hypothetical protein